MSKAGRRKGERQLRVRTKRLKEVDNVKLSLALWLIAKGIVENKGDGQATIEASDSPSPGSGEGA